MHRLRKLLIANRGEIALRIMRTAHGLGLCTVAIYSDADLGAPHVAAADEAVRIGPGPAAESYLSVERVLDAATRVGADAIHPGYGFLSENAELAAGSVERGLVFVGPPAAAIALMGDKALAKRRVAEAAIPCVPGYEGADQSHDRLAAEAERIGYPLLVKAVAGGGGRGMRVVHGPAELAEAVASARSEAMTAFGRAEVLLERLVPGARHVEVQVFADDHGSVVHLGERDCSAQRRYQKIIEESPSPAVDESLRARLGRAAVSVAEAINYVGAGTVEFLLGSDGAFYFMEMNTRLQVEHPVTELWTGLDLVAWQLAVAEGGALPLEQTDIRFEGHVMEARLYAEDPSRGFLPQTGRVLRWRPAVGPGVRVDAGICEGQTITDHYDAMLAKIIARGATREIARRRLVRAIRETVLLGVTTNREFLGRLLESETFVTGSVHTGTVDEQFGAPSDEDPAVEPAIVALASVLLSVGPDHRVGPCEPAEPGASRSPDGWSSSGAATWTLELQAGEPSRGGMSVDGAKAGVLLARVGPSGPAAYRVVLEQGAVEVALRELGSDHVRYEIDGLQRKVALGWDGSALHLDCAGRSHRFCPFVRGARRGQTGEADGEVRAPLGGRVLAVHAAMGERVDRGQCLLVVEAMKMEHRVLAPRAGVVSRVGVRVGDQVAAGKGLLTIDTTETPA